MGRRRPCCSKEGLNRGAWIASEDKILTDYIKIHGEGGWRNLPGKAGLKRCGKSCRLRWLNYLKPGIKRGNISHDEEELIIRLHRLLGNRWSLIAGRLPGRTDNEIKNYWNSNLAKKVQGQLTSTKKVQTQLTSTSTRKHLTQFKEKKKPFEERTLLRVKPPQVVRTKALRCTKAFFGPQPHDVEGLDPNIKIGSLTVGDFLSNNGVESTSYDGMTLITPKENPNDFMKDFNMDLSNLLDSDFFQLCQFNSNNNNNNNDSLRSCDQAPFLFTEEMLDDWRESDCAQHNISSDLQSLALFLDTEEDWLSSKND